MTWPYQSKTFVFTSICFLIKGLWKKIKGTKGHLTSHRRQSRWSVDCPAHFMGLSCTIYICYDWAGLKCNKVLLRQRWAAPKISAACFGMINFSLSQFLRNWVLGKKDLKWLRLKKNSLWSLRELSKIACCSKSCLSLTFPMYAKLCFNRLLKLQPLRMRMSRV